MSHALATRGGGRMMRAESLSGTQKAAIVLMAMGRDAAARITQTLPQQELEAISLEIARLEHVPVELVESVLSEWQHMETAAHSITQGGVDYARQVLETALGPQKAAAVLRQIETQLRESSGFHNLRHADPQQVATLIRNEHPQTIALLLAHLDAVQVALVMKELPGAVGGDVLFRLARMEKVLPEVLAVLERSYGSESNLSLTQDMTSVGGPHAVAAILNLVATTLEKELLDTIAKQDVSLSEEIKNLMFVFEDIVRLDDRGLQRLLRDVQTKELATALKGASEELRTRVYSCLSNRAADAVREEMDLLGPVRLRDVEIAQMSVVRMVRALEESGEVVVGGGTDDMVM
jgi:flagellar motor switch protein FliG